MEAQEDVILGWKIEVDGARAHAGRLCDVLDGRLVETLIGEEAKGGLKDVTPPLFGRLHGPAGAEGLFLALPRTARRDLPLPAPPRPMIPLRLNHVHDDIPLTD